MTNLGENIKKYRIEKGLTQKDLAEKLFVTAQAVSRWENNEVEPGIQTLDSIASILEVSMDELCGKEKPQVEPEVIVQKEYVVEKPKEILAVCSSCQKPIYEEENVKRYTSSHSVRHGRHHTTEKKQHVVCKECYDKIMKERSEQAARIAKEHERQGIKKRRQSLVWGFIVLGLGILLSILLFGKTNTTALIVGIVTSVFVSLELGCILLNNNFIFDVVTTILSWGFVKMPGVIFSLDLDGIIWLLTVKLFLFLLGLAISISCGILAIAVGGVCAIFVYPVALTKNYKNPASSAF